MSAPRKVREAHPLIIFNEIAGIGHCGDGGVPAPMGPMAKTIEGERPHKECRLRALGSGQGERQFWLRRWVGVDGGVLGLDAVAAVAMGCGAAPRLSMVNGVEREQLREGCQLRTMSGGVGGRRVRPRWAGRKYLCVRVLFRIFWSPVMFYVKST
jgi:hypothetical protein